MKFEYVYKIPVPKKRLLIDLPQTLIDYYQIKGMTEVVGTIGSIPFQNGLLPRGKGQFSICFTRDLQKKVGAKEGDILEIDLKVIEKPEYKPAIQATRRQIDKIELVMQNRKTTCGQACIAMLSGKPIEAVIADMGTSGATAIGQLMEILDVYKIGHGNKNLRLSKKNSMIPELALLTLHFPDYRHWSIYYKGIYYDPEFGISNSLPEHAKITSFLEIYTS